MSGTVKELPNSPYSTGANGDAAEGDFDTQWALRIVGDYLLAVNAGGNPTNGSISVFKINRSDGSLTQVDQNTSTPAMDNMDSREIRAASIAAKDVGGNTLTPNFFARAGNPPMADSKDLYQTNDGYLYVSGAFQTHAVAVFKMAASGALTEVSGSLYAIPSSVGKTKDQHAFLGFTGFEK